MKRKKLVGIPFLIIALSLVCLFGIKKLKGSDIVHYKQYIIPAQGQIVTEQGSETKISFIILDEEELSELATKENVDRIEISTDSGKILQVNDWTVESMTEELFQCSKKLSVSVPVEEECILSEMTICYRDKKEKFDIGKLKIIPIDRMAIREKYICYLYDEVFHTSDNDKISYVINESSEGFIHKEKTIFSMDWSTNMDFVIHRIDLGIDGMGIDPVTIQESGFDVDFGEAFTKEEKNKPYTFTGIVETLPSQNMELCIKDTKDEEYRWIAGVRRTKEYNDQFVCTYFNPLYLCSNEEIGDFSYASDVYSMDIPVILGNAFVKNLLEEKGS